MATKSNKLSYNENSISRPLSGRLKHRTQKSRSGLHRGFTIVELLIVIVVIAILAAIALVVYTGIQDRARASAVQSDLTQAAKQLAMDETLTGSYPSTVNTDGSGDANEGNGLFPSAGTAYEYTRSGSGYCLSAVNANQAYHITNGGSPQEGVCPGHTGPIVGGGTPTCDTGYIPVPGNSIFGTSDFCVAKYEAKNVGGVATSQAAGTPWVSISQANAITAANNACDTCHLITEAEWLTIAHDVLNVASNWTGGSVGSGTMYRGHTDNNPANSLAASTNDNNGYEGTGNSSGNQRRTLALSNGEVIWDFAGNVLERTTGQVSGAGNQPGPSGGSGAWREWNAVTGTGNLSPNPFPSFGTPTAINWTGSHGIGRVWSDPSQASVRAFLRSGNWNNGSDAGVLMLHLDYTPGSPNSSVGFRVAQ